MTASSGRGRAIATAAVFACSLLAAPVSAQVTPAAGYTPPDDTPSVRVGATIFADYTITQQPKVRDADGNEVTLSAFNVARAYINVTGQISHIVAFRVTPDIARETGAGSSLNGSYTYRLKYAYAQFNLDDWMPRGSWVRLGAQQTPWVDFIDNVYRYRFQGTTMEDREGILSSSDLGVTFHYNFTNNYGDLHGGFYNGENYNRPEVNGKKALMVRGTLRPLPGSPLLRGLRVTGFINSDAYVEDAERRRGILGATYEHTYVNAGANYLWASDQVRSVSPELDTKGYSIWATPKTTIGWEALLRYDHLDFDQVTSPTAGTRGRAIAGIAYWFPRQGNVSAAVLLDYERVTNDDFLPERPDERRYAVHMLINF